MAEGNHMWLRGRRFIIRLFFTVICFMVSSILLTHSHLAMAEVDTQHTMALTYCTGANDSMRRTALRVSSLEPYQKQGG